MWTRSFSTLLARLALAKQEHTTLHLSALSCSSLKKIAILVLLFLPQPSSSPCLSFLRDLFNIFLPSVTAQRCHPFQSILPSITLCSSYLHPLLPVFLAVNCVLDRLKHGS